MKTQPKKGRDARFREHDNGNMRVIPAKAGISDTTGHDKERDAAYAIAHESASMTKIGLSKW